MQNIIGWLEKALHLTPDLEAKILSSIIIVLLFWLLQILVVQLINHQCTDLRQRYHWRKTSSYLVGILALFLIGRTWLIGLHSLATFLGLASAGLAIALRTPLTSLLAWIFIVSQRPFEVGDRVQIGQHAGDVIDMGPLKFTLLEIGNWVAADQSTSRILHVPNGEIFDHPLANYTTGLDHIWHEIQVMLTFESNWEKAKVILQDIVNQQAPDVSQAVQDRIRKTARRFMIYYHNLTPTVYTKARENGVSLTVRYLCPPRKRRSIEEAIWEDILRTFRKHPDIEFAYPTQRLYHRMPEGSGPLSPPFQMNQNSGNAVGGQHHP